MDTTAKPPTLASPKLVKNAKGAVVPSSQMAHIAYGCGKSFPATTCQRPLTAHRAHVHHDRECTQADLPVLSRDIAKHIREAERHRPDVQERIRWPARGLAAPTVPVSTVSEHHDPCRPRRAYRSQASCVLWVEAWVQPRHMLIGVAVESRNGNVYCGDCQDFIYDPDLEARRLQKGASQYRYLWRLCIANRAQARKESTKIRPPPTSTSLYSAIPPSYRVAR